MSLHIAGNDAPSPQLDTSYISFAADENIRSPRTPTYVPDTPLPEFIVPSGHAGLFFDPKAKLKDKALIAPPPEEPLAWVWICHLCRSRYPLGVTRRCLVDGHYYCSGETDRPSTRKKKKNKSCSSEFDYVAWKAWGDWRRQALKVVHNPRILKGCDYCDFPSQCRYPVESHPAAEPETMKVDDEPRSAETLEGWKEEKDEDEKKKANAATANKDIDFDKILSNIFPGNEEEILKKSVKPALNAGDSSTNSRKRSGAKKKKISQDAVVLALEDEMAMERARMRELVGMVLWEGMEDVDLEKVKAE